MKTIDVQTAARQELVPIDEEVRQAVAELGVREGAVVLYSPHTTCAVTVNEGYDPEVRRDVSRFLGRLVPHGEPDFRHAEGNSDAHILTSLVGASETFLVEDGELQLGRWQNIFLAEFDGPRPRRLWIKALVAGR